MLEYEVPVCKEKGSFKDIRDDRNPEVCYINKKRVDREWGPWEIQPEVSTYYWTKRVKTSCYCYSSTLRDSGK